MTALSTWQPLGSEGPDRELHACLECDSCVPPSIDLGASGDLRAEGWRFENLEAGPHYCRLCAAKPRAREAWTVRSSGGHQGALPDFLIIGAAKSGTTSLHRYLSQHPEIHMPEEKELHFFQDPGCLGKLDVYASFFDSRATLRGEASPGYTVYPLVKGVPERIREALPDVKLIYLVRDPVDRAITQFNQPRRYPDLELTAEEAFRDPRDPYNWYLAPSRYATQIERYLRVFPREQLLVLGQEDLLERRRETLRRAFRFLGVDEEFASPRFDELANTSESKRESTKAGAWLRRSRLNLALGRLSPRVQHALRAPARRVASKPLAQIEVDENERERLRDALAGEAARFRELVGEPLAAWQV